MKKRGAMSLRDRIALHLGSSYFMGLSAGDWFSLLRENGFRVAPSCLTRAVSVSLATIPNTIMCRLEDHYFRDKWRAIEVPPPLFILGHFRSGTTHLHNLLAQDSRFAYLNAYQASFPDMFLLTEETGSHFLNFFLPKTRPFDNIKLGAAVPYEDEIALTNSMQLSSYVSVAFPQRQSHYDRFLTLRDCSQEEVVQWRQGFMQLLQKLTLKYQKPLILKSPPHTCRIKLLLDMFPNARFVHIHRHPYEVIQSTLHMIEEGLPWIRFQDAGSVDWTERTLHQWHEMYEVFFAERSLIPSGHFHEIAFTDLERDPLRELRRMYESLAMPSYEDAELKFRDYLGIVANYSKNSFPAIPEGLKARIAKACSRGFTEWNYEP
jgi:hypothetical protein